MARLDVDNCRSQEAQVDLGAQYISEAKRGQLAQIKAHIREPKRQKEDNRSLEDARAAEGPVDEWLGTEAYCKVQNPEVRARTEQYHRNHQKCS